MFTRAASALRGSGNAMLRHYRRPLQQQQKRRMGGGEHWMEVSEVHTRAGEFVGFVCWMWIFHRARHDLPVVLGWRHPWEHAEDPWAAHDQLENIAELESDWDTFAEKAIRPGEDDDDDDDDEEDEEDEDEGEDD
eukprot:CAMPEP_0113543368 /NCGR_PEP_ID=MMETSP0015_2-20120614/10120_1 /TAXON_ID=2838 /ORGANISM="Odontella" /LENGTH=134 /DNA_ID=CAMNT_0000443521 /DNA_START=115 /DNA_END=522 /DNA_ORIENTATION=- /assembly_acc=CAM_ASM_000160